MSKIAFYCSGCGLPISEATTPLPETDTQLCPTCTSIIARGGDIPTVLARAKAYHKEGT